MNAQRIVRSTTLILLLLAIRAPRSSAQPNSPEPIDRAPDTVVFGEVQDAFLWVGDIGDVDGDGAEDLIVVWYPRPTRFAYQVAVVLGRSSWPAQAGIPGLPGVHSLGLPVVDNLSPNAPAYAMRRTLDANGDGLDDIVVIVDERQAGEPKAREARVFFGRQGWGAIDVTTDPPDLLVRQGRIPWRPTETRRYPMPDSLYAGDFNGDGRQDLAVGSCGVPDPELQNGPTDVQLFFAPEGGRRQIELGETRPDVVIQAPSIGGQVVQLGCGAFAGTADDLNGDGMVDLVLQARKTSATGVRSYVAYGRQSWPGEATLEDVASMAIEHRGNNPGAWAWQVEDISGDGHRDLVVDFFEPHGKAQCVLFSGRDRRALETLDDCDLRITDLPVRMVGDVDGDGARDLFFAWEAEDGSQRIDEWRIVRGPFASGRELAIGEGAGQGDFVFHVPDDRSHEAALEWWFADITGDGREDMVTVDWAADSPNGHARAGRLSLFDGPVARDVVALPTATATTTATATATGAPTIGPTVTLAATPPEPTASVPPPTAPLASATPTATATTSARPPETSLRLFLPIAWR